MRVCVCVRCVRVVRDVPPKSEKLAVWVGDGLAFRGVDAHGGARGVRFAVRGARFVGRVVGRG